MTDPIRIPIDYGPDCQTSHHMKITPDIARQIVALSGIKDGFLPINDAITELAKRIAALEQQHAWLMQRAVLTGGEEATPPAGDAATVQALVDGMKANTGTMHGMAIAAMNAIRAGNVDGIYDEAAVKAEQAAMYAAGTRDGVACCQKEIALLRAQLAEADECAKKANDEHSVTRARLVDERDEARAEVAALKAVVRKCARVLQWHLGMWQRKDERMMIGALEEAWAAVGREYCEASDAELAAKGAK